MGRRLLELLPGHKGTSFLKAYLQVAETGGSLIFEDEYDSESTDKHTCFRIVVVKMDEDIAILTQDITERKQIAKALRESEERFRAVQENSLDRFTILKPLYDSEGEIIDFTYIYLNAQGAKAARRRPEELIGLRMTEIWPACPQTRLFAMYKLAVETGQVTEFEDSYITDGMDEYSRSVATPIPGGIAIATQIITEHKHTVEALCESERNALNLVEELNTFKDDLSTQVKALNKLQDINSHFIQQDDIKTVYTEILEAVIQLSNADFGNMQIARDDGRLEIIAGCGLWRDLYAILPFC